MFKNGDFIIYGNYGVCKVTGIGNPDSSVFSKDRIYYTLEPSQSSGSKVFTPVDNEKVPMRPVISKKEALHLIDEINNIEILWIPDEKRREMDYKEAVKTCDCRQLVKIIKTIYLRKQSRIAEGKKVTASDEKYFRIAEDYLYGELSVSLNMGMEEVKQYVAERVEEMDALQKQG